MKKKVFFVMSTDDYSGAEAVNITIIENLRDKYDFYWVSRKGKINNYLQENKIKWIEIEKLSVSEIKKVIKKFQPDIIHATDYKSSVICSIAKGDIPLIEHLHNNSPWIKKFCINSLIFLLAGLRADKILTVSKSIEEEYIFSKFLKNKIKCIGNPVSRKKILDKVSECDYEKKYDICCVGRLTPQKNPKRFLDIINEIKKKKNDIKVIWIGKGEQLEEAERYKEQLNLQENVTFLGFKKNPYKYMAGSKIFMLTSDWEGYGLVSFEALTLGLPCITSNVGGIPDIVDDKCGKICLENKDFENIILNLLSNEAMYKLYSENAIKKSIFLDNTNEYIERMRNIYEKII